MVTRRRRATVEVLDERAELTFGDLCRMCSVHAEVVIDLVDEGVLEPRGRRPADWRFSGPQVRRAQAALRLQRDLGVNVPGVALALDLLDEIERLRRRRRRLLSGGS